MITINLRPGTKRDGGSGPMLAGLKAQLAGMFSGIKEPWMMGAGAALLLVAVLLTGSYLWTGSKLAGLEPELETARSEHARYQGFLRQKRQALRVRDSILVQIGTISAVDGNRYVWAHILDEINSSLPEMTWLTNIVQIGGGGMGAAAVPGDTVQQNLLDPPVLRITGRTGDLQRYTAFLRSLEASPWLTNVLAVQAKTIIEGNRALTEFIVQATYSPADSSHVRTVPIIESVVGN